MHSVILDDKGRERVRVFYKAAFYDRRANAYLTPRYSFTWLFPPHEGEEPNGLAADELVYAVFDCGKEIKRFTPTKTDDWEANNAQKAIGEVWMSDNFPLSGDPLAYWD